MDEIIVKKALSYSLGADLHDAWCQQELLAFFKRANQEYKKTKNFGESFRNACFVGEEKRNEVEIDTSYLEGHEGYVSRCLTDFNVFMNLFHHGVITVKRFAPVQISLEEASKLGADYKDGKENVLRDFSSLSSESKTDSLEAARVAIDLVYNRIMFGDVISLEDMEQLGAIVHIEWLRRNPWVFDPNRGNPKLAVPYSELSKEEQERDKAQVYLAQDKVHAYIEGLIDINAICVQNKIVTVGRRI
ncbi:MAG: hypothetical protein IKF71_04300 [Bacilli bacterium]|nr:hypothetical protein [Bacilli bacterium]